MRKKYGEDLFEAYKEHLAYYGKNSLGTIQMYSTPDGKVICNIFGQGDFGYNAKQYTDLKAFEKAVKTLKEKMIELDLKSVAMPYKIAPNRGGARWNDVYDILKEVFNDNKIKLVLYMKEN